MRQSQVIVTGDERAGNRVAWWCAEIARAWPNAGDAPVCRAETLGELILKTDPETEPSLGPDEAIVLVFSGPPGVLGVKLLDRLIGTRTPALVLTNDLERMRAELHPQGIPVEPIDAAPESVTTTLHTLRVRQASVDLLNAELRVTRASQSGLSGEIGRLHDELQLAGSVQQRFLPRELPNVRGHEFGVLFQPCGYVSGDIYDIVAIDDDRVAFMVADAVGHGVPAALLTLVLGRALRQPAEPGATDHPLASPGRTLARLNEDLCIENDAGDRFATAICGVIDTSTSRVTLAGAGHPAPVLTSTKSPPREIDPGDGPLLGVFPGAIFGEREITLDLGETLVLFSDGFETAFPDPEEVERAGASRAYIDHFASAAKRALDGQGGAHDAAELLAADLAAQAGSLSQRDDLTALMLMRAIDRIALSAVNSSGLAAA